MSTELKRKRDSTDRRGPPSGQPSPARCKKLNFLCLRAAICSLLSSMLALCELTFFLHVCHDSQPVAIFIAAGAHGSRSSIPKKSKKTSSEYSSGGGSSDSGDSRDDSVGHLLAVAGDRIGDCTYTLESAVLVFFLVNDCFIFLVFRRI